MVPYCGQERRSPCCIVTIQYPGSKKFSDGSKARITGEPIKFVREQLSLSSSLWHQENQSNGFSFDAKRPIMIDKSNFLGEVEHFEKNHNETEMNGPFPLFGCFLFVFVRMKTIYDGYFVADHSTGEWPEKNALFFNISGYWHLSHTQ